MKNTQHETHRVNVFPKKDELLVFSEREPCNPQATPAGGGNETILLLCSRWRHVDHILFSHSNNHSKKSAVLYFLVAPKPRTPLCVYVTPYIHVILFLYLLKWFIRLGVTMDPTSLFFSKLRLLAVTLETETERLQDAYQPRSDPGDDGG